MKPWLVETQKVFIFFRIIMTDKAPIHVCVTGAAGLIAYSLVPQIASGQVFGLDQPVIVHLLDIEFAKQGLQGLALELEDMDLPLLHGVIATTNLEEAFTDVDWAILCGAFPRKQGMERKDLLEKNAGIFKEQGIAISKFAKKTAKVLVVGNPANTNALLLQHHGNLPKENVVAMTRLDHNRARNMVGRKIGVPGHLVKNVIIWGNHSPTMFADLAHATVNGQPVRELVKDDKWCNETFVEDVAQRGSTVIKIRGSSSATSAARGAIDCTRDWFHGKEGEFLSMGVWSDGTHYGAPAGVYFSVPCICKGNGEYQIVEGLPISDLARTHLDKTAAELVDERQAALTF